MEFQRVRGSKKNSKVRTFCEQYEGMIASNEGSRKSDIKLSQIAKVIRGESKTFLYK